MSETLYKFAYVFYKKDKTPGWIPAVMAGDEDTVKDKAAELKIKNNWFNVRIFAGGISVDPVSNFENTKLEPRIVHMTSNWVYSAELDKWFLNEDDVIPAPTSKCEITDNLTIVYDFTELMNDDLSEVTEEDDFYATVDIEFRTPLQKHTSCIQLVFSRGYIQKFLNKIKSGKYACLDIEEFSSDKFLVWTIGDKIRLKIQSYYDSNSVVESLDILIDKKLFTSKLRSLIKDVKREAKKLLSNPKDYIFVNQLDIGKD